MSLSRELRRAGSAKYLIEYYIWRYIRLKRPGAGMRRKKNGFVGMCRGERGHCNVLVVLRHSAMYDKYVLLLANKCHFKLVHTRSPLMLLLGRAGVHRYRNTS